MLVADLPHALPAGVLAGRLDGADLEAGLSEAEAAARLARVGPNRLPAAPRPGYARIAARQFADPLVALLGAAAAVSALIGEGIEAAVIAAIVALNAALGFFQEAGAERAVIALRSALAPTASVVRDGRERPIAAAELVPGDVVVLREGDRVPADGRVVAAEGLEIDESALTGESVPVVKRDEPVDPATPLAERRSMAYAGTGVTRGRGRLLVAATGPSTEVAAIVRLTAEAKPPPTPLQQRLGRLSRAMVVLGLVVTAGLTAGMLARGEPLEDAFLVGVAVAVAAVPEGLAATVTIALAQGAAGMARRGAIVRRLAAVETLGSATTIAADKTGTLTLNELRVAALRPEPGYVDGDVLRVGMLASTAELLADGHVAGDPVDGAFLLAGTTADPRLAPGRSLAAEIPFDPWRKRLTRVYQEEGGYRVVVKGAPEVVVERCRFAPAERKSVLAAAELWAADGLRVLAVAERTERGALPTEAGDRDLALVGLAGLRDPLRPTAADSIRAAADAGIRVAMLTGDHPVTAAAIARELELVGEPLTGAELERLEDEDLTETAGERVVFARVTPADKLRLVEALQRGGHVVAVTGDGINDAPALRRADVGVAMGASGTEAAREAAEIVLTDDDLATIVAAIGEGRRITDNVRAFVAFLLSANLGEVLLFAAAILAGIGAPMTVVMVLTVNLLTDGLPAIALTRDPASPSSMREPPRPHEGLFDRAALWLLALAGVAAGLAATAAYAGGRELAPEAAQTMAFATIALAELVLVYSIRSPSVPAWRGARNALLAGSVLCSAAIVLLAVYLPALNGPLGTEPLRPLELSVVAALAVVPAALLELLKAVRRRAA